MKKLILIIVILLVGVALCSQTSPKPQKEKYYQEKFAERIGGEVEVILSDKSRVDIITDEFAIEVDFAHKWAESVGQSLYYSLVSGKKPGVLLVVNGNKDFYNVRRLKLLADKYGMTVWVWNYVNNTYRLLGPDDKF